MPFAEIAHMPRGESGFKPLRTIEYRANCVVFSQRGNPVLGSGPRSSAEKTSAMNSPTAKSIAFSVIAYCCQRTATTEFPLRSNNATDTNARPRVAKRSAGKAIVASTRFERPLLD
jgi:hypothetical protein